jgi:hypothetical protein
MSAADINTLEAALLIFYTGAAPSELSKARAAAEKYVGQERAVFAKLGCVVWARAPPCCCSLLLWPSLTSLPLPHHSPCHPPFGCSLKYPHAAAALKESRALWESLSGRSSLEAQPAAAKAAAAAAAAAAAGSQWACLTCSTSNAAAAAACRACRGPPPTAKELAAAKQAAALAAASAGAASSGSPRPLGHFAPLYTALLHFYSTAVRARSEDHAKATARRVAGQWSGREEALWRQMGAKYGAEAVDRLSTHWLQLLSDVLNAEEEGEEWEEEGEEEEEEGSDEEWEEDFSDDEQQQAALASLPYRKKDLGPNPWECTVCEVGNREEDSACASCGSARGTSATYRTPAGAVGGGSAAAGGWRWWWWRWH